MNTRYMKEWLDGYAGLFHSLCRAEHGCAMTWIAISIAFLARLLYLMRRVKRDGTDEHHYRVQAEAIAEQGWSVVRANAQLFRDGRIPNWLAPPTRVLYLFVTSLAVRVTTNYRWTMLSAISSSAGVLCVALAAVVGHHLGGWQAATASALLVGASPLMLGLGRRVLVDVPAAATQLGVLAAATLGADWWPLVAAALVVMLLTRESSRTLAPGLLMAVAWLWGWDLRVLYSAAVAAPFYCVLLRLLIGAWPWQFQSAFGQRVLRRIPKDPSLYATQRCTGGLHRLVVDLVLVSPLVALAAPFGGWLSVSALVMIAAYGLPWLDQQIRTCLVVDLVLRIAVAVALPYWALVLLLLVDVYVFWRVWIRGKLYDPTSYSLAQKLGMWR